MMMMMSSMSSLQSLVLVSSQVFSNPSTPFIMRVSLILRSICSSTSASSRLFVLFNDCISVYNSLSSKFRASMISLFAVILVSCSVQFLSTYATLVASFSTVDVRFKIVALIFPVSVLMESMVSCLDNNISSLRAFKSSMLCR